MAWVGIGVLGTTLVAVASGREPTIRLMGLVLQWAGIGTVAVGVQRTRRLFKVPGWLSLVREWWSRRPRWNRSIVVGAGGLSVGSAVVKARVEVWTDVDTAARLQDQVAALVSNTETLRQRQRYLEESLQSARQEHGDALHEERKAREDGDLSIDERLAAAHTGGLHFTLWGTIWLIVGVTLSTLPHEIANLLQ